MGICFQLFVSRLVLISRIDLVEAGAKVWVDGYTVNHWKFALDIPLWSICGSWMAQMLKSSLFKLMSRSCWLSNDLLMFCCHI